MRIFKRTTPEVGRWRRSWAETVAVGVVVAGLMTAADLPLRSLVAPDTPEAGPAEATSSCVPRDCR